jgi:hypothetical protein
MSRDKIKKVLKWVAATVVGLIALLLLLLTLTVWILTPERLTPLVSKLANESLDARVNIGRVELSLWHTFPHFTVEVDSLDIVSNGFASLSPEERALLPADADTLLRVGHFRGGVNVAALLIAKISLYNIELGGTMVNAVQLNSLRSNFNIVPPSEEPEDTTSSTPYIPDISLNRFALTDNLPIRYRSVADSIDLSLTVAKSPLVEDGDNAYRVTFGSTANVKMAEDLLANTIAVDLGGGLTWSHKEPMVLKINDFGLNVGTAENGMIKSKWDATVDFADPMTLREMAFNVGPVAPSTMMGLLSEQMREEIGTIDTDMLVTLKGRLTKPFNMVDDSIPCLEANLNIPACKLRYNDCYTADRLAADIDFSLPGNLDSAVVTVKKLTFEGMGAKMSVTGKASNLIADATVDGHVSAEASLASLPGEVLATLPKSTKLAGNVKLDTDVRCAMSNLSMSNFHRMMLRGTLSLEDLKVDMPSENLACYTHYTEMNLGTASSFVNDSRVKVDSLLTVSVKSDTLFVKMDGMDVRMRNARVGAGCINSQRSADTTAIIPFGGMLQVERMSYSDTDSAKIGLSDIAARMSLKRYENDAHVPQVTVSADAGKIFFTDKINFFGLQKSHFDLNAHLKQHKRRTLTESDSLRMASRKAVREAELSMHAGADSLDLTVDKATGRLLRDLQMTGHLTAKRGGMFTPYFPLRNRISDFDMEFSTDSLVLNNVRYMCGKSDFKINGSVRNIRRALTRGEPIDVDWHMTSDSINVNEILNAFYVGSDYAAKLESGEVKLKSAESDADLDRLADNVVATADSVSAVLIPLNLEAHVKVNAKNVKYADMDLKNCHGELMVSDGALNLHDISATSDIGSIGLNALYSAPLKDEIRFGMGLELNSIDIKKFIGMVPAVDSLMPLLNSFEGIIDASIAATADIDSTMNIVIPSLDAALRLNGKNLVLLDAETFRTIAKWLMFKDKGKNMIDEMGAEVLISNSTVQLFPFVFDFDRYRLAVMGSNDLDLNYKYHISVLKSPIPFKFGINLSGNAAADKMKVRLGRAKYKAGKAVESVAIVDNTRVNLLKEIDNVFKRGAHAARLGSLNVDKSGLVSLDDDASADTISAADSILFIQEGLLPAPVRPDSVATTPAAATAITNKKK